MAKIDKIDTHKKIMLSALENSLGIVTDASEACGICRASHYEWLKSDPEYAKQVELISEMAIDFAESHLKQQIKENIPVSTIFYLKTKGKKRGYVERIEQEQVGQMQIIISDKMEKL